MEKMNFEIKSLSKKYGNNVALNEFSCQFTDGIYGLLGPNGAGKSTLINIIVGILRQNSGEIFIDGVNISELGDKYLDYIGYLPQHPGFYNNFTAMEFMLYICGVKGISKKKSRARCEELLEFVNLSDVVGSKIGSFSGGMKRRLGIAQALINDPKLLILDEPTAGLDPNERIRFRNLISRISENRIILTATHIVPDIEFIAKEVILLKKGDKISQSAPQKLINSIENKVWSLNVKADDIEKFVVKYDISNARKIDDGYELRIVSDESPSADALNIQPNLEDVYLHCFGGVNL